MTDDCGVTSSCHVTCLLCLFVIGCCKNRADVTAKQILTPVLKMKRRHQHKNSKALILHSVGGD